MNSTYLPYRVTEDTRLDTSLRTQYELSHKAARKLISTGKVYVNQVLQQRWEFHLQAGDQVSVLMNAANPKKNESLGATLIYQDDALAVLCKPSGLLSAPAPSSDEPNALVAVNRLCRGPRRPRVVHRLDKETSGLLIFARTLPATRIIQDALKHHQIRRLYRCIVQGEVKGEGGYISSGLVRDTGQGRRGSAKGSRRHHPLGIPPSPREVEGKWALTRYRVITKTPHATALEIELFTGRTHQIRIHLSELGHPILGERVYAPCHKLAPRLALHAAALRFIHPFSDRELLFEAPWPDDLKRLKPLPQAWLKSKIKGKEAHT